MTPASFAWATGKMEYRSQGSGADWDGRGGSGCAEVSFELPVGHLSKMERQVDEEVWSHGQFRLQ